MGRTQKIILWGSGWAVSIVLFAVGVRLGEEARWETKLTIGLAMVVVFFPLWFFAEWFFRHTFKDVFGFTPVHGYGLEAKDREQAMVDRELAHWAKQLEAAYLSEDIILREKFSPPDVPKSLWNKEVKREFGKRERKISAAKRLVERSGRNGYWLRHGLAKAAGYSVPDKFRDSIIK
jgi:hypothetical protein